jgi:hypothetical protein
MQSADPSPGGLWPRDMLIAVERPSTLMLLLFVRSAWELGDNGVPLLDGRPDPGLTRGPAHLDVRLADERWARDWARAFEVVAPKTARGGRPDDAMRQLLDAYPVDTVLGADADTDPGLSAVAGLSSRFDEFLRSVSIETYWRTGLDDDALRVWQNGLERPPRPGSLGPEHDAVEWLVPVWRSGVRTIIELPFAGYHVERIDREHVVVSGATRNDPELYSLALSTL